MDTFLKSPFLPFFHFCYRLSPPPTITMSSQVKLSPPHISDTVQSNIPSSVQQPYSQDAQGAQNASIIAQNYRDQCQLHFVLSRPTNSYSNYLYYLVFAQCAMGNHERKTEYGLCGIITAVVSFFNTRLQRS